MTIKLNIKGKRGRAMFGLTLIFSAIIFIVLKLINGSIFELELSKIIAYLFITFLIIASMFTLVYWGLSLLAKKGWHSSNIFIRLFQNLGLSLLIGLLVVPLLYSIRFFVFNNYNLGGVVGDYLTIAIITFIQINILEIIQYHLKETQNELLLAKAESKKQKMKYQILKEQMNPHFLFNSLNVLSSLVYVNQDKANKFTKELSKLYRYVLNVNSLSSVSLDEEIQFLTSYQFVIGLRFNHSVVINIERDKNRSELFVVPLSLQLAVENAIKHNSFSYQEPLEVAIKIGSTFVEVSNPKRALSQSNSGAKLGLEYLSEMYQVWNKNIEVIQTEDKFTVQIPFID